MNTDQTTAPPRHVADIQALPAFTVARAIVSRTMRRPYRRKRVVSL